MSLLEIESKTQSFFDRQERISWWDQSRLFNATVLVVGAGALGNEVLKNLALLGVGHILVIDFDTIEDSNLSRTVLFRAADAKDGAAKAQVAAARAKDLNPHPDSIVQPIYGDVVWDLGTGVYRQIDVVLGCLDNLEARLAVNLNCWRTNTPWIDGAMWELSGSVAVYDASQEKACYECSMAKEHYQQAKVRYSCTNETVKTHIRKGYEPTTQTTSAIIAAVQTQEMVKLLHGLHSFPGRQLVFNGSDHFYVGGERSPVSIIELAQNPNCLCHHEDRIDRVLELVQAQASKTTVRQLLEMITAETGWQSVRLELGRRFVIGAICSQCGRHMEICRPLHLVQDKDAVCPLCEVTCPTCGFRTIGQPDCPNCGQQDISELQLHDFHTISIGDLDVQPFLDYELVRLGIPPLHIVKARNELGENISVEISGDRALLWSKKPRS